MDRRTVIKRGAAVGGLVWATPVVTKFAPSALAQYDPEVTSCHAEFTTSAHEGVCTTSGPHAQDADGHCKVDTTDAPSVCGHATATCTVRGTTPPEWNRVERATVSIAGAPAGCQITEAAGVSTGGGQPACAIVEIAADGRSATFTRHPDRHTLARVRVVVTCQ